MKLHFLPILPILLVGVAFPALAAKAPRTLVVREGLSVEQLDADSDICLAEAKAAERGEPVTPAPTAGSTTAQMAGDLASGMLKGFDDVKRFMAAHDACLARLGYRQVELTSEERKEYGKLKDGAARSAYVIELSQRSIATGR